jgi:hypothetical protein
MAKAPTQSRLFAYVDAVSYTKNADVLLEPDFAKEYKPFIVNRALSYHEDSVMAANLMNERPWLDAVSQATFLLNTLRPRKRFSKWLKADAVSDDVRSVAEYYACSIRAARDLVSLHTSAQLTTIRLRLDKGGPAARSGVRHAQPPP